MRRGTSDWTGDCLAGPLDGSEHIRIVQNGESRYATTYMIAGLAPSGGGGSGVTQQDVDDGDAATLVSANAHSDAADAATLTAAQDYADDADTVLQTSLTAYIDTADANTLSSANNHSDAADAVTLSDAQAYADSVGAATLTSANGYTDSAVGAIVAFTDERAQDAVAAVFAAGSHTGITVTYDDVLNKVSFAVTITQYTDEMARDALGAALVAGAGISITPNDGADTIEVASLITQYTDEMSQDAVAAAFAAGSHTGITVTYDDVTNKFNLASTITQYTDEMARDALGTALTAGAGISITPNDGADTIAIASLITQYTDEMVDDRVAAFLAAGTHTGITVTYDDALNKLSLTNTITQYTDELARDAIGTAVVQGTGLDIVVDDSGNTISFSLSDEYVMDLLAAQVLGGTGISIIYADGPGNLTISVVINTDGTMASNSDTLIPSQKAVRTYARSKYALLQSFTGTLDEGLEEGVLTAYQELSNAGLLAKLKGLYVFCVPTQADALRNWISPGTSDLAVVGTPTFTANEGFTGNGTDAYLTTGTTAVTFGLTQADAAYGIHILTPSTVAAGVIGIFNAGVARKVYQTSALSGNLVHRINAGGQNSVTPSRYTGLFAMVRDNGSTSEQYLDDTQIDSIARASAAQAVAAVTFLGTADTTATEFSTAKAAYAFVATALTRADVANIYQIMTKFMRSRPAASIPAGTVNRVQAKNMFLQTNQSLVVPDSYMIHAECTLTLSADSIMRII